MEPHLGSLRAMPASSSGDRVAGEAAQEFKVDVWRLIAVPRR
jgi:hypothetical protein